MDPTAPPPPDPPRAGWTLAARCAVLFVVTVLLVAGLGWLLDHPHSRVEASVFDPAFLAMVKHNFTIEESATGLAPSSALPALVRWDPRSWLSRSAHGSSAASPDFSSHYRLKAPDGPATLDCDVLYLGRHASYVEIRASAAEKVHANDLRAALIHKFPGLPVKLTIL